MYNYNNDSDEEFNYDLPNNVSSSNVPLNHNGSSTNSAQPIVQDFIYDEPEEPAKVENDLQVEDDWNFDFPDHSQQQDKPKTRKQEMLDAQKSKLMKKKKTLNSDNYQNPQYENMKKKRMDAPTIDDMYHNEYQSKIRNMDKEVEGEIQHESLKKKLEEQRQNQRVEFVADDPAMLLKQKTIPNNKENQYQSYAMTGNGIGSAEAEMGMYNDMKPKKKKKKRKTVAQPNTELEDGPDAIAPTVGAGAAAATRFDHVIEEQEDIQGHYLGEQEKIPASYNVESSDNQSTNYQDSEQAYEVHHQKPKKKGKKKQQQPNNLDDYNQEKVIYDRFYIS